MVPRSVVVEVVILLALGLDTLAVAISFGLTGLPASRRVRVGLILALYSVLMSVAGFLAGESLSDRAAKVATYLAGAGLIGAGAHGLLQLRTSARDEALFVETVLAEDVIDESALGAPSLGQSARTMHLTAILGSVDKLAVGLAFGAQDVRPVWALVYLACQSFVLGVFGTTMGKTLGAKLGHKAEAASRLLLIGIGMAIVLSQVLGIKLANAP